MAIQLVGILAMIAGVLSRIFKEDGHLLLLSTVCGFLFFAHFLLLNETAAALANGLGAIRFLLAYKYKDNPKHFINVSAFVGVSLYFLYFAISNTFYLNNYLVLVATLLMGIGTIYYSGIKLRFFFMAGDIIWWIISFYAWSVGGMILDTIAFTITAITVFRIVSDNKKDKANFH